MKKARIIGALVAFVILAFAVLLWQSYFPELSVNKSPDGYAQLKEFETQGVPNLELLSLEGSGFHTKDFSGKIVVINFWASWCNPCVEEFPSLIKLAEKFEGDVVIVAISNDEKAEDAKAFLKMLKIPENNFFIARDFDRKIAQAWGVFKIPESFVVGRNGKLIKKVMGIDDWFSPNAQEYFQTLISSKN